MSQYFCSILVMPSTTNLFSIPVTLGDHIFSAFGRSPKSARQQAWNKFDHWRTSFRHPVVTALVAEKVQNRNQVILHRAYRDMSENYWVNWYLTKNGGQVVSKSDSLKPIWWK